MNLFLSVPRSLIGLSLAAWAGGRLIAGETQTGGVDYNFPSTGEFYVGVYSPGTLTFSGGFTDTVPTLSIVGYNATGTLTVTDPGTVLTVGPSFDFPSLAIGYGASATLNIENGGVVNARDSNMTIGFGLTGSNTATVNVDGTGSQLNTVELSVSTGTMNITNGGAVHSTGQPVAIIGDGGGVASAVNVTGNGSTLTTANVLYVGYQSSTASLNVNTGGLVATASAVVGGNVTTGNATVGAGGTWQNNGSLWVGYGNSTGTLNVTGGGQMSSSGASLGLLESGLGAGAGTLNVTGTGSTFTDNGDLDVGVDGTGHLNITAGGTVTSGILDHIGMNGGSNGFATVSGAGSTWTNTNNLFVGNSGNGTLNIQSGGVVTTDQGGYVGFNPTGVGTANIDGSGSQWNVALDLWVGFDGQGTMNVTNGGRVQTQSTVIGSHGTGTLNISGPGSILISNAVTIGSDAEASVNVSAGGELLAPDELEVDGYSGNATLNVDDGAVVTNSDAYAGREGNANAIITLTHGGILNVNGGSGTLYLGSQAMGGGSGTLNIGGAATDSAGVGGTYNGGQLIGVSPSTLQFNTTATQGSPYDFVNSRPTIDGNAISISGDVFIVNTAGYNVLTGSDSTATGGQVNAGTLAISSGGSLSFNPLGADSPTFTIASGATLQNDGSVTNGGAVVNNGTVNGTGSYEQLGGSTTTSGQFNQNSLVVIQGSFIQQAGTTTIATTTNDKGLVHVEGGQFTDDGTFTVNGSLEIDSGAFFHAGTFNQTHGSTFINNGTLDPISISVADGTFGGVGTVDGDVTVTGGEVDVGGGLMGALTVNGSFDQTGGAMVFDVFEHNGQFTETLLNLDGTDPVTISNTTITFDFLNGADAEQFYRDGLFNLNQFFGSQTGDPFGVDYPLGAVFTDDVFTTNDPNATVTGVDLNSGDVSLQFGGSNSVPDQTASLWLLAIGLAALPFVGRVRRVI